MARFRLFAGTRPGTFLDWRALASMRGVLRQAWNVLETLARAQSLEKLLQTHGRRCPRGREADHFLAREGRRAVDRLADRASANWHRHTADYAFPGAARKPLEELLHRTRHNR
jgi:hypothetical protein